VDPSDAPPGRSRAFALVAVVAGLLLLALSLYPLWQALLLAALLAGALSHWHEALAKRLWNQRWLSALLMTVGVLLLVLLPVAALVVSVIAQAEEAVASLRRFIAEGGADELLSRLPPHAEAWARERLQALPDQLRAWPARSANTLASTVLAGVSALSHAVAQLGLMLIALFFLLADGPRLARWLETSVPLGGQRTLEILHRFRQMARTVLGSNLVTGLVQGTIATLGYVIAQVPQPLFFGLLTFFSSFIPAIGTALVAFPLAAFLLVQGRVFWCVFLAVWAIVVVGLADNFVRPWLLRGGMHVHGAVVFFSILGSLAVFGAMGLVVGPASLVFFLTMLDVWKRDYARGAG
jgi:predicted PurR-regulated permease PerM